MCNALLSVIDRQLCILFWSFSVPLATGFLWSRHGSRLVFGSQNCRQAASVNSGVHYLILGLALFFSGLLRFWKITATKLSLIREPLV